MANAGDDVLMARVRGPKEAFDGWAAAAFDAAEALHAEGVPPGTFRPPDAGDPATGLLTRASHARNGPISALRSFARGVADVADGAILRRESGILEESRVALREGRDQSASCSSATQTASHGQTVRFGLRRLPRHEPDSV